jgi:hypothetical protein
MSSPLFRDGERLEGAAALVGAHSRVRAKRFSVTLASEELL